MAQISWTRRSYEARVLLIPLDPGARAWVGARAGRALEGITIADDGLLPAQQRFAPEPVPCTGEGRAVSSPLEHAMHDADVVVLFTRDLAAADRDAVAQIGDAARLSGQLLGAVIISPGARWEDPDAHRAVAAIRESADNVVILKDDGFVLAFLQVLRGGTREPAGAGA
ncbi:hypothetical protein [Amycolatopsis thermophila]|uniref:Uncharacterized protein n=1 Tax=Amycolatopsis thermophila TaxID=206084 RepID=A0ABU0F6L2_9PSEU|nr:hypothetical protein [Amycolatopsis thermophila]MDQ0383033.1 hypothetical protein [Amycolatopsis thermophila]